MIDLDRAAVINLTTVGRTTGRPHRIEIWFAHHEATIYMLSGGGDRSDWVRNIIANRAGHRQRRGHRLWGPRHPTANLWVKRLGHRENS